MWIDILRDDFPPTRRVHSSCSSRSGQDVATGSFSGARETNYYRSYSKVGKRG
ncbi:MAG: hypothetical protein ACYTFG_00135 [Planctomycetota bacterium]